MQKTELRNSRFKPNEIAWMVAVAVAGVCGLAATAASSLLIANYLQLRAADPLNSPDLAVLHQQYLDAPQADARLAQQIEALDVLARRAYFSSQAHIEQGGWLLLGLIALMLAALRVAAVASPRLPWPIDEPEARQWAARAAARRLIAGLGGTFMIAGLVLGFWARTDAPVAQPAADAPVQDAPAAPPAPEYPDWAAMQQQWPSFRGPGGYGVALHTNAPLEWDAESGKNIKWKVETPLAGKNSPVVWGDRVFISGATETEREVFCFDANSGELKWRRKIENVPNSPSEPPEISEDTGFAASTLVAHGDRVVAIFANGDLACLDVEGNVTWVKNLGMPENHYGHSSSLIAYENLVFVQYDQTGNAKLFAFDIGDGREVWAAQRKYISWASPAIVQAAQDPALVLNSEKDVDAYDPATGKLLWTIECLDGEVAPSPAYGGGMFFVANDNAMATGIKLTQDGATGAVKAEMAWQWDQALPDVSSPVGTDTHFYVATSLGYIICLNAQSGEAAWGEEFDNGFYASPIIVGDRVYAVDKKGTTHIFKTGGTYEALGACKLGEETLATPAFMDRRIYFRTNKHLICVESSDGV